MHSSGYFVAIAPDECRRLIRDAGVGRVAWVSTARGIQVLPVNFGLMGDRIVFRVDEGSIFRELMKPVEVAFQVDDIDLETSTGWAVLVQGTTSQWEGDLPDLDPWAPGYRDVVVAIEPTSWAGRSVSADKDE